MNPLKKRLGISAGTVLLCSLAACSRSSDSAQSNSPPPPINPCSVLSPGDIKAALGSAPIAAGSRENLGPVDNCSWSLPTGGDLHITFYNPVGAALLYNPSVSSRRSADKIYEPVTGLGDQAVYRDESSTVFHVSESVEVVKGKRHFDVLYNDMLAKTSGPSKSTMVSLASTVLNHTH